MSQTALSKPPSPLQLRDDLEAMVLKELLGPGSAEEEKEVLHEKKKGERGPGTVNRGPKKAKGNNESATLFPQDDLLHGPRPTVHAPRWIRGGRMNANDILTAVNAGEVKEGLHEKKKGKRGAGTVNRKRPTKAVGCSNRMKSATKKGDEP